MVWYVTTQCAILDGRNHLDSLCFQFYMRKVQGERINPDSVLLRQPCSRSLHWCFVLLQSDLPLGLVVRIPGFHPGGPGSNPGVGSQFFFLFFSSLYCLHFLKHFSWILNWTYWTCWTCFSFWNNVYLNVTFNSVYDYSNQSHYR